MKGGRTSFQPPFQTSAILIRSLPSHPRPSWPRHEVAQQPFQARVVVVLREPELRLDRLDRLGATRTPSWSAPDRVTGSVGPVQDRRSQCNRSVEVNWGEEREWTSPPMWAFLFFECITPSGQIGFPCWRNSTKKNSASIANRSIGE